MEPKFKPHAESRLSIPHASVLMRIILERIALNRTQGARSRFF
ncbi:hypothetical protein CES85_5532 [Ochrobactrum quorumnocens]|uniref:Uncharacterized protein n=1 Tax=Ochrobactrum quorumnocens TaxID=271865 RepID=A0A248UDI7_9HYPH|nr:hypothetical protein CES85_5532 [[Ochrobactrum] quorumnocens]